MKKFISKSSLLSFITTFLVITACNDSNVVSPGKAIDPSSLNSAIKLRGGSLVTTSQLDQYANMTWISAFASAMQFELSNLGEDSTDIKTYGEEEVILTRMNEWLVENNYTEIEELPSFCYHGDEVTGMPSLPSAVRNVLEDAEDVIINNLSGDGPYDEFKFYIENLDVEALPSGNQSQVATILYGWDILLHYLDEHPVLGYNWLSGFRCAVICVGTAVGTSLVATPVVGIIAGVAAWAASDVCFDN